MDKFLQQPCNSFEDQASVDEIYQKNLSKNGIFGAKDTHIISWVPESVQTILTIAVKQQLALSMYGIDHYRVTTGVLSDRYWIINDQRSPNMKR